MRPKKTYSSEKTDLIFDFHPKMVDYYMSFLFTNFAIKDDMFNLNERNRIVMAEHPTDMRMAFNHGDAPYDTDFDALYPILITDLTSELSQLGNNPNTVKFIWRWADKRPRILATEPPGIFSAPFNRDFN